MIDWLQNPHADYVVAAYGLAFVALGGLAVASWSSSRACTKAWRKIQSERQGRSL